MFPIQLAAFPGYHADRTGRVLRLVDGRWQPVPLFGDKYRLEGPPGARSAKLITAEEALELSGQPVPSVLAGYELVVSMLCGECEPHRVVDHELATAVEEWEAAMHEDMPLHEYLDMTEAELAAWQDDPTRPMRKDELLKLESSYRAQLHVTQKAPADEAWARYTARDDCGEALGDQDPADQQPDLRPAEREDAGRQGQAGDPGLD